MKLSPIFLFLAILVFLTFFMDSQVPQAEANATIVMGSVRGYTESNLLLTNNTGGYIGIYNTTSTLELEDGQVYYMMIQPSREDILKNPLTLFDWLYAEIPLIFSVAVVSLLVGWIIWAPITRR